ncbi:lipoate--protein ligase family protein [Chengkuizengella axinellae]|uniref:Biotin/lipoate A/B protein ligase family protein n=1 Tax=Chengkuizengella axinellae TaxID=3064388 RepID=A0ABT9IZ34_9BACL|nr:biotin/lipoate A/B protein ligase family protein [Chengkuizengella sp. 2205SS18-9]MDP5274587.1 biotin/lipoate A/B protein ligase family protein [Chengkuizengella sp. 2205SS18-9]
MKNKWRFIQSANYSPAENMAIDEAILIAHSEGKVPPTLRFYGWNPATLSIGYFQKSEEIDLEAVKNKGIGFVRRQTGGRAVLHDQELTYSMIVSESYPGLPKTVNEAYRVLSQGLLYGFQSLDLRAEMVNLATEEEKQKYASASSSACFDSPSWYELVVEGRKIAGSAQTRQKGVVLQHGSILLEMDIDLLFDLLKYSNPKIKKRLKESFTKKAVAINDLRRDVSLDSVSLMEVEAAFKAGISKGMDIELEEEQLTSYELELVDQLVEEKYGNDDWNYRK